jgi:hypothetical protein
LKLNQDVIDARKEWLVSNSRCSEVLDSEFYYQLFPSLDFTVLDIPDQDFLRSRQLKGLETAPPDPRYLSCVSVTFSVPLPATPHTTFAHKLTYACSKGVTKNPWLLLSPNKSLSLGRVKSYGSVTTVITSAGLGAQGSPVFNELGKCWGFLVGAHSDLPERWTREVGLSMRTRGEEAVMMREIDRRIRDEDAGRKHRKFGKKEKKDKDKKKEKKREKKAKEKVDLDRGKMYDSLPTEYYDFTSEHGLIPALPSNNSYNRNFVLSFGHSGVKFILARLLAQHDSRASLLRLRDKLIQKQD